MSRFMAILGRCMVAAIAVACIFALLAVAIYGPDLPERMMAGVCAVAAICTLPLAGSTIK